MAVQLHVALSTVFRGAASVAGGVYWCSEGNSLTAQVKCMQNPSALKVDTYVKKAQAEAQAGTIEKLANLKRSKIYIFASPKDGVIKHESSDRLYEFYSQFVPQNQIVYQNQIAAAHSWVTKDYGNECDVQALPWLNNCKYDMAGDILKHLYGPLNANRTIRNDMRSQIYAYDQTEFQSQNSALFDYGYIFIPTNCGTRRALCKLHVALHGCQMNPDHVRDQFAVHSGLNSWAEANNIVVLYPQAQKVPQVNPYACWDWFGFTGKDFANRNGSQIIAIQKMVYRLMGTF
ncbi:MAG: PHB depolymerase [Bdellovibrionaceae bacterium]|nr:PHB depolymerase [Pseudobdellovibrionaceae bacterium]